MRKFRNNKRLLLIVGLNLLIYMIAFTRFSFYGYWTDYVIGLAIAFFTIASIKSFHTIKKYIVIGLSVSYILPFVTILMMGYIGNLKVMTVPQERMLVGNYLINEYFIPVGAGRCGYGIYWKTKAWKYFPMIEAEVDRNYCTHEDYGSFIRNGKWE